MRIFMAKGSHNVLIEPDTPAWGVGLARKAAELIAFTERVDPEKYEAAISDEEERACGLISRTEEILNSYVNWAKHGFVNSQQAYAKEIYATVEAMLENDTLRFVLPREYVSLFTTALQAWQNWKTQLSLASWARFGRNWGEGSGFSQMSWAEHNQALRDKYKVGFADFLKVDR